MGTISIAITQHEESDPADIPPPSEYEQHYTDALSELENVKVRREGERRLEYAMSTG